VVDRALALNLVGDQFVFLVEEKDSELFSMLVGLRGCEIRDYFRSRRRERALRDFRARQSGRGRADEFQFGDNRFTDARNLFQARVRRVEDFGERSEAGDEPLGKILCIPAWNSTEKNEFEGLVDRPFGIAPGGVRDDPCAEEWRGPRKDQLGWMSRRPSPSPALRQGPLAPLSSHGREAGEERPETS
jgi:hypothetical protein